MASEGGRDDLNGIDALGGKRYNLTVVVEAVCDLVSNDHSYSAKVEGLVLMFAEERRLQDSCWKNLSKKKTTKKQ